MSSLLEERIKQNIERQAANFKRQNELLRTIKADVSLAESSWGGTGAHVRASSYSTSTGGSGIANPSVHSEVFQASHSRAGLDLQQLDLSASSRVNESVVSNSVEFKSPTQELLRQQLERVRGFKAASDELQDTVEGLEEQLEKLEQEKLVQSKKFAADLRAAEKQRRAEKKEYLESLAQTESEAASSHSKETDKLASQLKYSRGVTRKYTKRVQELELELEGAHEKLRATEEEAETMRSQLRTTEDQEKDNLSNIMKLREQLSLRVARISKLEEALKRAGTEKAKLQGQLDMQTASMAEIAELKKQRIEHASQIADLTGQLANEQRRSSQVKLLKAQVHRLTPFEDQARSLTTQVKKLTAERGREEELKRKATLAHSKSIATAKEIRAKLRECNISLSGMNKTNRELQDQNSVLKDTAAEYTAAQAKFKQQAKLLKASQGKVEGLVSALNECKEEINTYKMQLADVADVPELRARLRLTEEELDEYKSQNAAYEASLRQWDERSASQEAAHAAMKEQHQEKHRRVLELSQSLEHHTTELTKAKKNIESFHEERRQFKAMADSTRRWEEKVADHVSEKEQLQCRISELEEVHRRVELTNHALMEAKESIKAGAEEKRALESAVVKCEELLSASEETARNLQAAYVLAMRALVPSLIRNQELIGQKKFLTFHCCHKDARIDRLEKELAEISRKLDDENAAAEYPEEMPISTPPQDRKKVSFRVAVIAVLAANRLNRFIGAPSALLPTMKKDGGVDDISCLSSASHQMNFVKECPASHWLGEKIRGQENKHAVANLASRYNQCRPEEVPQIAMPVGSDPGGHASRSNEQHMLLKLLLHFQKDDTLESGSFKIARRLAHSGLAVSPQISLADALSRGSQSSGRAGSSDRVMARREQVDRFIQSRATAAANLSAAEKKVEHLQQTALDSAGRLRELRAEAEYLREREKILSETVEALESEKATMIPRDAFVQLSNDHTALEEEKGRLHAELEKMKTLKKTADKNEKLSKTKYDELSDALSKQQDDVSEFASSIRKHKILAAQHKRSASTYATRFRNLESKLREANFKEDELMKSLAQIKQKAWDDRRQSELTINNAKSVRVRIKKELDATKEKLKLCDELRKKAEIEKEKMQEKYFEARKSHRKQMAAVAADLNSANENMSSSPKYLDLQQSIKDLSQQNEELRQELKVLLGSAAGRGESTNRRAVLLKARDRAAAELEASLGTPTVKLREGGTPSELRSSPLSENSDVDMYLTEIDKKLFEQYGTPYSARKKNASPELEIRY